MQQPEPTRAPRRRSRSLAVLLTGLLAGLSALVVAVPLAAQPDKTPSTGNDMSGSGEEALVPPDIESWYRVELLIFAREDATALGAERWEPLPTLNYPEDYRYLVDPTLTDQRLSDSRGLASTIDERGVQTLTLSLPPTGIDPTYRPDAILEPPFIDFLEEPDAAILKASPDSVSADEAPFMEDGAEALAADTGEDEVPTDAAEEEAPEEIPADAPLYALPFTLLGDQALEFRAQARQLRRQGKLVLFHGTWWTPLAENDSHTLVLDRGADLPPEQWPAMQGSVRLYRTRYLHAELDLWLNTNGSYMPEAWRIPDPPQAEPTLYAYRSDGTPVDPLAPALTLEDLLAADALETVVVEAEGVTAGYIGQTPVGTPIDTGRAAAFESEPSIDSEIGLAGEEFDGNAAGEINAEAGDPTLAEPPESPYPYRHAIVLRQASRMRGGEIHYLDHPVLSAVIRLTPVDEEQIPAVPRERESWRARHGLEAQPMAPAIYAPEDVEE